MKKLLIFTLIVSSVTLAGLWSGKKFCAMMPSTSANQPVYSKLDLNAEQSRTIKKLEDSFQKEADELCVKVCDERIQLLDQIKKGQISPEAIDQKLEAIGQIQILLEKKTTAHILEINKILTPVQSVTYLERIYQKQCRMASKEMNHE